MLQLMFPSHLAVGYLAGAYSRFSVALLVLGSALPDVVDRPLYWIGLTSSSHTLGHSIAVVVPACLLVTYLFGLRGAALSIGWLAHVATDFVNVATAKGIAMTPYYVLYLAPPPEIPYRARVIVVSVPPTNVTHVLHPAVLAIEILLLGGVTGVLLHGRGVLASLGLRRFTR